MNNSKQTFVFSFLPVIAYWYLEANYPVKIALIGGIVLGILEIVFEKLFFKHVHQISKLNFALLILLGGFSLMEEDGVWFKLQPFLSMWAMAIYMTYKITKGEGLFAEMMREMNSDETRQVPSFVMRSFERNIIILMFVYGAFMGLLAVLAPTSYWAFFKTAGFLIVFAIFSVIQIWVMKKDLKK